MKLPIKSYLLSAEMLHDVFPNFYYIQHSQLYRYCFVLSKEISELGLYKKTPVMADRCFNIIYPLPLSGDYNHNRLGLQASILLDRRSVAGRHRGFCH